MKITVKFELPDQCGPRGMAEFIEDCYTLVSQRGDFYWHASILSVVVPDETHAGEVDDA